MFLNQQKKTQILEASDLQTLLKAISNNSEVLTESEISIVSDIENYIKEDTKLVLSQEAEYEYYKFLEKVVMLDDSLNEGYVKALVGEVKDVATGIGTEVKGYFEDVKSKIKHVDDNIDELLRWCAKNRDVEIKNDSKLKSFFKTSILQWRFYYLLDDTSFNNIVNSIKEEGVVAPTVFDIDLKKRASISHRLEKAKTVDELSAIAVEYRKRCNTIGNLLVYDKKKVKGFPLQIMLTGFSDLSITIKRIINLNM